MHIVSINIRYSALMFLFVGAFLDKPMKEVVQQGLVGFDIFCWFIVGEMIGRRSIIGYKV